MVKNTVKFNNSSIYNFPNVKPVFYRIKTYFVNKNYTGVAKRGRVRDRLEEHLRMGKDRIPGAVVEIEQLDHISEARKRESNIIARTNPKYNKQRAVVSFFEPVSFSKAKGRNAVKKMTVKKKIRR